MHPIGKSQPLQPEPVAVEMLDPNRARAKSLSSLLESLSKDNGYGNENITPRYNLALLQVFCNYSVLFML